MNPMFFEFVVILLLLAANGVFAMSEIAVISARKPRLRKLADEGDARARIAVELAESPNRFLSTVQIGITLVGILAGAFGGATLTDELEILLKRWHWMIPYAEPVAFGWVVVTITFLSLVIGELVPKRLALNRPEEIALRVARPLQKLSALARPIVSLLSLTTDALLRPLGVRPAPDSTVTEDEVRLLVREGARTGVFQQTESAMVERVLALDRIPVRELMTPRAKIIWINADDAHEAIWHKIVVSAHTTFPVYAGNRDQVLGLVSVKAIYAHLAAGIPVRIRDLMTPPLMVPATQNANVLLETFKKTGKHIALVVDEFGGITGLVSLHDIMEAIVGDFPSQDERHRPRAKRRDDGSWLVDGMLEIEEFQNAVPEFPLGPNTQRDYQTVGGWVVKQLGHLPTEGESFAIGLFQVEVIDMDGNRVDKILLLPNKNPRG